MKLLQRIFRHSRSVRVVCFKVENYEEAYQRDNEVITKLERKAFVKLIKGFTLTISGTRPIEEAIVTSGGISLKEMNPKTMESKLVKGLYFAGEIIDLDAFTGGFNLQIAFSTGYAAGLNA